MKIYRWGDVKLQQLGGGVTRRLIVGENLMLAEIFVPKGVRFPSHQNESEQITIYQKGRAVYESAEQSVEASTGDILHIRPGVAHADRVLEDTVVLDIFAPPRHDWLKG